MDKHAWNVTDVVTFDLHMQLSGTFHWHITRHPGPRIACHVVFCVMADRLAAAMERLCQSKGSELNKCIDMIEKAASDGQEKTSTLALGEKSKCTRSS